MSAAITRWRGRAFFRVEESQWPAQAEEPAIRSAYDEGAPIYLHIDPHCTEFNGVNLNVTHDSRLGGCFVEWSGVSPALHKPSMWDISKAIQWAKRIKTALTLEDASPVFEKTKWTVTSAPNPTQ
jgi:hypothetical protein